MDKESLRKEVSEILKSVAWMWEPRERDYLPDSCDKDVDALMQLFDTYSTQARVDELKHIDSLTYSFMNTGKDFIYEYRQSAVDQRIKELSTPKEKPTNGDLVKGAK